MKCWSCQAPVQGEPFCPGCGRIQPRPQGANQFSVFGLPPTVEIPADLLEKRFRELSLKLHPDRFAAQDPTSRRYSLEQTTALNEAYKTLKDPVRRAFYLLKLLGIDLDRDEASTQRSVPMELLEEVMTLRERLEELRAKRDLPGAQTMAQEVGQRREEALGRANEALRIRLASAAHADALTQAYQALAQVRYFGRFLEEVEAMEETPG